MAAQALALQICQQGFIETNKSVSSYKMPKLKQVLRAILVCIFRFKFHTTVNGKRARQRSRSAL